MKIKPILTAIAVAVTAVAQPAWANFQFTQNEKGEVTHYNGIELPPIQTVEEAKAQAQREIAAAKKAREAQQAEPATRNSSPATLPQEVFFTGKPLVGDNYQFKYRVYSPEAGRWLSFDPSGYPDGPNNLLYVNNWVMTAVDAYGLDIIHINNSSAVGGNGHSGAIIGNANDGYSYHSYGPKSSGSGASYDTANGQTFASLGDALNHAAGLGYDRYQGWNSTPEQDSAARDAFGEFSQGGYNVTTHNCLGAVQAALDAAGISYEGALSFVPNQFYNLNQRGDIFPFNGANFSGAIE